MSGPQTIVQWLTWSSPKNLKSPRLYELDRQSQTRPQGCHWWGLQDEPFGFYGQTGTERVALLNSLQHAFDRFSAGCDQTGTKIRTKKIEVLCL